MVPTLGQQRVRMGIYPYNNDAVARIKEETAALIDLCETLRVNDPRLAALAQTAYEEAAMWAIKAASGWGAVDPP